MKNRRKWPIAALVLTLIAGIAFGALTTEKDNIIIYSGIAVYRNLHSVLLILLCVFAALTALLFIVSLIKPKAKAEPVPDKAPTLSVKEKLQNSSLRELLKKAGEGKWSSLAPELSVMISQLEQMDTYQERLHALLQENDIKALSDTEEVLEQAEQSLCQNVRKIINYLNVFDEKDVEVVRASVAKTNEKNREQMNQVRDFVVAVTDFVNQQGSSNQDPDMLNNYKAMILDSLKEGM